MGYTANDIRNICLLGHGGDGKSALCESMLFTTKAITRLGKRADGTTVSDFDDEEKKRQYSISASVIPVEYNKCKINVLDNPGYFDFAGQIVQSLRVADAGIICVTAKSGIGVGTEKGWKSLAKAGLPGESHDVVLELKLLADVGLVGFPNVGKSTLLSVVSKAHPKIANYHFTTLYPNLGVVYVDEGVSFVMADIPGIIEGASEGAGLGHDFLRHIDRCRLLVHLVDVSGSEGRDPIADFDAINQELRQYSPELADRPQIVVANKTDLLADPARLDAVRAHVEEAGYTFMAMSAATHQGTRELVQAIAARLAELPPVAVYEPEYVPRPPQIDTSEPLNIRQEDNTWLVEGPWLQRLMANINFSDYESRMYFDKMLRQSGLFDRLERMGIQDGDIVSMYNLEFEYQR